MKKIVVFALLLMMLLPVYAEVYTVGPSTKWEIGQYVDDFGDPTGEEFAYCIIEDGTFSNSATRGDTAKVRVIASLISSNYPMLLFKFELHNYNWDNQVEDFYSNSNSSLQFKNEKDIVVRYSNSNSKYFTSWNLVSGKDAENFFEFLKNSSSVKSAISCEKTKYNFEFSTANFLDCINHLIDNPKFQEHDNWFISVIDSDHSDYRFVSITKNQDIVSNGNTYGVDFTIAGKPDDKEDAPSIMISLNRLKDTFYIRDESEVVSTIFTSGSKRIEVKEDYPTHAQYITLGEKSNYKDLEFDDIYSVLSNGDFTEIEFKFDKQHDPIKFSLKSSELKEYLTYPYSSEIMSHYKQ